MNINCRKYRTDESGMSWRGNANENPKLELIVGDGHKEVSIEFSNENEQKWFAKTVVEWLLPDGALLAGVKKRLDALEKIICDHDPKAFGEFVKRICRGDVLIKGCIPPGIDVENLVEAEKLARERWGGMSETSRGKVGEPVRTCENCKGGPHYSGKSWCKSCSRGPYTVDSWSPKEEPKPKSDDVLHFVNGKVSLEFDTSIPPNEVQLRHKGQVVARFCGVGMAHNPSPKPEPKHSCLDHNGTKMYEGDLVVSAHIPLFEDDIRIKRLVCIDPSGHIDVETLNGCSHIGGVKPSDYVLYKRKAES